MTPTLRNQMALIAQPKRGYSATSMKSCANERTKYKKIGQPLETWKFENANSLSRACAHTRTKGIENGNENHSHLQTPYNMQPFVGAMDTWPTWSAPPAECSLGSFPTNARGYCFLRMGMRIILTGGGEADPLPPPTPGVIGRGVPSKFSPLFRWKRF
jgi:hypothetical protein